MSLESIVREGLRDARRAARAHTHSEADADDALNAGVERFLRAAQRGRLDGVDQPVGYLVATVRSAAVDIARADIRSRRSPSSDRSDEPPRPDELEIVTDSIEEARAILERLPERQRLALELVHVDDQSHDQAGEQLGLHANAVTQLVHRARRSFRTRWAERVAGEPLGKACHRAVDDLFVRPGHDELEAHLQECERCRLVRDALDDRRRLAVPILGTAALPRLRPTLRSKTVAATSVAGIAAVMAFAASESPTDPGARPRAAPETSVSTAVEYQEPVDGPTVRTTETPAVPVDRTPLSPEPTVITSPEAPPTSVEPATTSTVVPAEPSPPAEVDGGITVVVETPLLQLELAIDPRRDPPLDLSLDSAE